MTNTIANIVVPDRISHFENTFWRRKKQKNAPQNKDTWCLKTLPCHIFPHNMHPMRIRHAKNALRLIPF